MFTEKTDYLSEAIDRLDQYNKEQPNIESILDIIMAVRQSHESVLVDLRDKRNLSNATGVTLDNLATYLAITRGIDTDEQFRARLKARILELTRAGQIQVLIDAYKSLTVAISVYLQTLYPMTVEIVAYISTPIIDEAAALAGIRRVKAAGIELSAIVAAETGSFVFATPATENTISTTGFSTYLDETTGGTLNGVLANG